MAIDTERYCLGCGRVEDRCVCEIEFIHGQPNGEHRGSRALDADFQQAAAAGFEPLSEEQKAEYERKLRGASAAISGRRR